MRCPTVSNRPSFLMSRWIISPGGAFMAPRRLGGFQVAPSVEAMADENTPDGGPRDPGLGRDAVIDAPLPAQCNHRRFDIVGCFVGTGIGFG